MDTERLRTLANEYKRVGVGGLFKWDEAMELCNLALEAAAALEQPAPVVAVPDWEDVPDIAHWDEDGKVKIEVVRGLDRRLYVKLDDGTKSIECVWPRKWRIQRQARPQPPQE